MQGKDYPIFGPESHEKGFLLGGKSPSVFRSESVIGVRIPRAALPVRSSLTIRRVSVTRLRAIRRLERVARSAVIRAIGGSARLIAVMVPGIIRAVHGTVIGISGVPRIAAVTGTLGTGPGARSRAEVIRREYTAREERGRKSGREREQSSSFHTHLLQAIQKVSL